MRRTAIVGGLVALAVVVAGTASLASAAGGKTTPKVKVSAALNVGQETPRPTGTKRGASGKFTATLTGRKLAWKLTYKKLTGPALAAHVHVGKRGVAGDVVVPLCGESPACTSGVSGSVTLTAAQAKALKAGGYYVNVHTAANPGGEIRGQITKLPG
ncbi:MAG: CHRD domain-containing protein [Thermoleophilia bacterium]